MEVGDVVAAVAVEVAAEPPRVPPVGAERRPLLEGVVTERRPPSLRCLGGAGMERRGRDARGGDHGLAQEPHGQRGQR